MRPIEKVRRTRIVVLAGLPGVGKTALAEALVQRTGGVVLSKDEVRAARFSALEIAYSVAQDDEVMSLILKDAQRMSRERTEPFVFLDGRTFSRAAQIQQVLDAAAKAGAEVRILHLECPEDVALQRIRGDQGKHVAADRDESLYFRIKAQFEPICVQKLDVDTSRALEECVAKCIEYITTETQRH